MRHDQHPEQFYFVGVCIGLALAAFIAAYWAGA